MNKIKMETVDLHEYNDNDKWIFKNKSDFDIIGFESFLDNLWKIRDTNPLGNNNNDEGLEEETQRFITIYHGKKYLKARNYVGYIKYRNYEFHLLPKIFPENTDIPKINRHILWWLSYSQRIKVPRLEATFNQNRWDNFLQILIYLFATHAREQLDKKVYQSYIEKNDEIGFIRGKLNTEAYIKCNIITGRWMYFNCIYELFEMDNLFNRVLKYTCKILLPHANEFTKAILRQIIFMLDDVSDGHFNVADCNRIKLNAYYSDLQTILDFCKLFISHSTIYNVNNQLQLFAFLVPMEHVFEEFVCGFLEKHKREICENLTVNIHGSKKFFEKQKGDIVPDVEIKFGSDTTIIADAKYKIIYDGKPSRNDFYQMVSYAIRKKCENIFLFYPKATNEVDNKVYQVEDEFTENQIININVRYLPIIQDNENEFPNEVRNQLIAKFQDIFPI